MILSTAVPLAAPSVMFRSESSWINDNRESLDELAPARVADSRWTAEESATSVSKVMIRAVPWWQCRDSVVLTVEKRDYF